MASFDKYRAHEKATSYATLDDMSRVEAHMRAGVVEQPDGSLKSRTGEDTINSLVTVTIVEPLNYRDVRAPALAVYAESFFDLQTADPKRRKAVSDWERSFMEPLRERSIVRARKELGKVEILRLPGAHGNFVLLSRKPLVGAMRRFLESPQ
jgi:hypothetical protein